MFGRKMLFLLSTFWVFVVSCRVGLGPSPQMDQSLLNVADNKTKSCSFFRWIPSRVSSQSASYSFETTRFGTEIEFPLAQLKQARVDLDTFNDKLMDRCRQCPAISCEANMGKSKITVTSNGQSLSIYPSIDPGVLEIRTQPLTYREFEGWMGVMDQLIFGAAADMGDILQDPDRERNRWSGHINVSWPGLSSPQDHQSMALLLNFFVDAHNHPELAMGVLGGDTRNAPPLALGDTLDHNELAEVVKKFQENHYKSMTELAKDLFKANPISFKYKFQGLRYALINVETLLRSEIKWEGQSGQRIELRGFFTPRSSSEMFTYYRIINYRLKYLFENYVLKSRNISYQKDRLIDSHYVKHGIQPPLDSLTGAKVFVDYLRGTGLNPLHEGQYLRDQVVVEQIRGLGRRLGPCFNLH